MTMQKLSQGIEQTMEQTFEQDSVKQGKKQKEYEPRIFDLEVSDEMRQVTKNEVKDMLPQDKKGLVDKLNDKTIDVLAGKFQIESLEDDVKQAKEDLKEVGLEDAEVHKIVSKTYPE